MVVLNWLKMPRMESASRYKYIAIGLIAMSVVCAIPIFTWRFDDRSMSGCASRYYTLTDSSNYLLLTVTLSPYTVVIDTPVFGHWFSTGYIRQQGFFFRVDTPGGIPSRFQTGTAAPSRPTSCQPQDKTVDFQTKN